MTALPAVPAACRAVGLEAQHVRQRQPPTLRAPALRKSRRDSPSHNFCFDPQNVNMRKPPDCRLRLRTSAKPQAALIIRMVNVLSMRRDVPLSILY